MKGIDTLAAIEQHRANLDGFVERVALPDPGIEPVIVVDPVDLHLQVKVVSDLAADRPDDLEHETRPALPAAAIFVGPVVDAGAQELSQQIAVGAVKLDAVEPRLPRAPRPLRELFHHFGDFGFRHRLGEQPVEVIAFAGRAQAFAEQVLDATHVLLAAGVAELHDEPTVIVMDAAAYFPPKGDFVVIVDHRVTHEDPAAH